jgi:CheY-like chemotaxis protein
VADTGQGISAEFLPHVFERFRQADDNNARRHGGLGLGLAIARELVELHGGRIRAESPGRGQGATFTVEFPINDVSPDAPVANPSERSAEPGWRFEPSPVLRGVRALVVEDDATTREVIQYLLERCEAEVTVIENAADGLRAYEASLRGTRFDLLLSDIGLPEMNGHELVRQVRLLEQQNGTMRPIPAVALTAYARDEDRAAALAAGFDAYLTKPIMAAALVKTVVECVGRVR